MKESPAEAYGRLMDWVGKEFIACGSGAAERQLARARDAAGDAWAAFRNAVMAFEDAAEVVRALTPREAPPKLPAKPSPP